MSARKHVPRNGPARALWEADKDTPVSQIPEILKTVDRWECDHCGNRRFTLPEHCGQCQSTTFTKRDGSGGERQ